MEGSIQTLCKNVMEGSIVSPSADQTYLDYMLAHLYVANPQARIGAIQNMIILDYQSLLESGAVPSRDFKTAEKYSFQYISACDATIRYS